MIDEGVCLDGRYLVGDLLGRGGMGRVHRAEDTRLDRPVAVKVLPEIDGDFSERLRQEAVILARLEHPSVVRILDVHEYEGEPFIVMELVNGPTLAQRLAEGPLDVGTAEAIAMDVAGGLAHAHERDVVHRDLKPANLVLDPVGTTRIVDFGIARITDATHLTRAGVAIGTAAYLAPEQLQDGVTGPPADIYTLGLVLLEALTGERPFGGSAIETAAARLARSPEIPTDLPAPWPGLLRTMTALDPEERPSASGVLATLNPTSRPADALDGDPTVNLGGPVIDGTTVSTAVEPTPRPEPEPELDPTPEPALLATPDPAPPPAPAPGSILVHDLDQPERTEAPSPPDRPGPRPVRGGPLADLARVPPWAWLAAAALVVVVVLVAALVLSGGDGGDPATFEPPAGMPPELAEALARLEEAVTP